MQSVEAQLAEAKDGKDRSDFKTVKSGSATFLDPSKLVLGADYAAPT